MPLSQEDIAKGMQYLNSLPGQRGKHIPEHVHDAMRQIADGITLPVWGRPASPEQMQSLFDAGATNPQAIHEAFGQMPHPQAPDLKLSEYHQYSKGYEIWKQHRGGRGSF